MELNNIMFEMLSEKTQQKIGDWGRLIYGDCFQKMKKIPENSIDAIITDPP